MLIAIPVANGKLCAPFGHCEQFALIEADPAAKRIRSTKHLRPPTPEPGVLPRWRHEPGVQVILAGGMGQRAQQWFTQNGMQVVVGAPVDTPGSLAQSFLAGGLVTGANLWDP